MTSKRKKKCILCGSSYFEIISNNVRDSNHHKVIKCKNCFHVQLFPIPFKEEITEFYNKNYQFQNKILYLSRKDLKERAKHHLTKRISLVTSLIPKKAKILEVGSGMGLFLDSMEKKGFEVIGIEISKKERAYSKRITNVPILNLDLHEELLEVSNFDIVVMFQVLEHIRDPISFISNLSKMLKQKGKLVVEVPNMNDLQLKINDEYKQWFFQIAHISYFTPNTLKKVLLRCGFKKVRILGWQRYNIENFFSWRHNKKPQLKVSTELPKEYQFLEKYYKNYLENTLKCDTLIAIAQLN